MARRKVNNEDNTENTFIDDVDENIELSEIDSLKEGMSTLKMDIEEIQNTIDKLTTQKQELTRELDICILRYETLEYGSPVNREQRHAMGVLNGIAKEREKATYVRSPIDVALGNRPRPVFQQMKV